MEKRVLFKNYEARKLFFDKLKDTFPKKKWVSVRNEFNILKNMFYLYRLGEISIPLNFFEKSIKRFDISDQSFFMANIFFKDAKWGRIKGGKENYKKHPDIYKKGRKIGSRNIPLKYNFNKNMSLSKGLCEFVGAFIGDGFLSSYRKGNYFIQFTGDKTLDYSYYNKTIIPIVKKLFGINPYVKLEKYNALRINFFSKNLFEMLIKRFDMPFGKKVYTVKIPNEILNCNNKNFIFRTIRGIFDTDGCVFFDKRSIYKTPYPRITLQIANLGLYKQIISVLKDNFKLYQSQRSDRKFYIEIYGHKQIAKWMSLIGFSNPRHLNKLRPGSLVGTSPKDLR